MIDDVLDRDNRLAMFQAEALRVAIQWIGRGEDPVRGNNRGVDIDIFRLHDGVREADLHQKRTGGAGAWCAVFASFCDTAAAEALAMECPHRRYRGAKSLVAAVAKAGRTLAVAGSWPLRKVTWYDPDIPPGAWIAWDASPLRIQGPGDRWKGHVGRVERYDRATDTLVVIEGNHNNRRSPTRKPYAVVDRFEYKAGAWRKRLARIASYV